MVLALTWLTTPPSLHCANSQRLALLQPLPALPSLGPGSGRVALVLYAPFSTRVASRIRRSISSVSLTALISCIPVPGTYLHLLLPVVVSSASRIRPPAFSGLIPLSVTGCSLMPLSVRTLLLVSTTSACPKPGPFGLITPLSPGLPPSARMALALTRLSLANGSRMVLSPPVTLLATPPHLPQRWPSVSNLIHLVVACKCTPGSGNAFCLPSSRGLSAPIALRMVPARAAPPFGMYRLTLMSSVRCVRHGCPVSAATTWSPTLSPDSIPTQSNLLCLLRSFSPSFLTFGAGWASLVIPPQPVAFLGIDLFRPGCRSVHGLALGGSIGSQQPIPVCPVLPPPEHHSEPVVPLQHCESAWKSALDHADTVDMLLASELAEGWIEEIPGGDAQLRQDYPATAVGKLGVVISSDRPPRLVVDSSISGVTCHTQLPNKSPNPTLSDVRQCLPLSPARKN